jgi:hypothetical protein
VVTLTVLGLVAVTAMLVCDAFEDRSPWSVLGFGAARCRGSIHGFSLGGWPFGGLDVGRGQALVASSVSPSVAGIGLCRTKPSNHCHDAEGSLEPNNA